jgi:hypothetical protein
MSERKDVAEINYPVWTEYRKKNGLDALGTQNSGVNLYQTNTQPWSIDATAEGIESQTYQTRLNCRSRR